MALRTGFEQHVSRLMLIFGAILLVFCTHIDSKPTEVEQVSEQQQQQQQIPIDHDFSYLLFADDSNLVERAAPRLGRASPRLGRASPRLGRASPRLGRRTPILAFSHFNHAGRYSPADDGAAVVAPTDDTNESDSWSHERRAAPRLGRSIHVHQEGKQV